MLHADAAWGGGTTEYALEAIKCAAGELDERGAAAVRVPRAARHGADDLARRPRRRALALTAARALAEPTATRGRGLLVHAARALRRDPQTRARVRADDDWGESGAAAAFAALWPDTLSGVEARRDLGFAPTTGLDDAVRAIFDAHVARAAGKT